MMRTGIIAAVLFVLAHFAMLLGVTTPEKFYFDEVHYVPAARQMLEPVMPQPMLNPMHPPLAKQLIALSIHTFGDGPLGWRYPAVLFGSLAVVAVYLGGLALFVLAVCIVIVAGIRLMQSWGTQFAYGNEDDWYRPDLWPGFRYSHFAACFLLIPAAAYLATFFPLYGLSLPDILEAQRRIFS